MFASPATCWPGQSAHSYHVSTTAGFLPHITLSSASIAPSSLTHLMLFFTSSDVQSADEVTQSPASKEVTEGLRVSLECTFSTTSTYYNIHWYRQYPGTGPQFILFRGTNSYSAEFAKERFSSSADKSSGKASLSISRVQLEDSAVYYCALETTVMNLHQHLYKNLLHLLSINDKLKNHSVSFMRK
uniref:Ig-like domain-containing protein n=1 Tax=Scleropages formosus TaxID=113540 RepID=A0A8C9VLC0_SCLFO